MPPTHPFDPDFSPIAQHLQRVTRRHFLGAGAMGLGGIALSALAADAPGLPTVTPRTHFAPKAKRVIYLHMAGSPPQQDLFDHKPLLNRLHGELCPDHLLDGERFAFIKGHPTILGSPFRFKQHGACGATVSELLPHIAGVVDDVTFVRSMQTDQFNHAPAQLFLYTGSPIAGRPSMGSWATYGLGSEASDLPGFLVLVSGGKTPSAGKSVWGSGFLPSVYQGVQCRSSGEPVLFVNNPDGLERADRRRALDTLRELNEITAQRSGDAEAITRIAQYELAFRMQAAVPEVMDIASEPAAVLEEYGATPGASGFANNCLLARRLCERGVRFVQLFDWGWDTHGTGPNDDIAHQLPRKCRETDRPVAALIKDLKRRGMLEDTLVVWSGEFGRTAMNERRDGSTYLGRDHHPGCFTVMLAGGGVKRGFTLGETDDLGYKVTKDPVHIHDLQATILHLLGLDHTRLTHRFQGRDFRLTDVHGHVIHKIIA